MRPIVHPTALMAYLENELAATKKELADMKKDLIATHEELGRVYETLSITRQELDLMTHDALDGEIALMMEENRQTVDMEIDEPEEEAPLWKRL